jgi:voltage-gated potassium channel Kch
VLLIVVATVVLAAFMVLVQAVVAQIGVLNTSESGASSWFLLLCDAIARILNIVYDGKQSTLGVRFINVMFWGIGIAVSGTIIGFITTRIHALIMSLRKSRSPIVQRDHVLILGWSQRIFPILSELAIANSNVRSPLVVVFADRDREVMADEIVARGEKLGRLRVITCCGDPTSPSDLARANLGGARSVIVLDAEAGDAVAVSTVLAIRAAAPDLPASVIVEIEDAATASALSVVSGGRVLPVRSQELVARVTAQASRQVGIAGVILELLDFDGSEIYMTPMPELAGTRYGEALTSFAEASVIGYADASGGVFVNPPPTTVLPKGASVITIAEDDDRVRFARPDSLPGVPKSPAADADAKTRMRILMIGWSAIGRSALKAMAPFLHVGSSVVVAVREEFVPASARSDSTVSGIDMRFSALSEDARDLDRLIDEMTPDEVIVLGYRDKISIADADAMTMLTMLHVGSHLQRIGRSHTPVIAEVLDMRRTELAKQTSAVDLVVSDELGARMIAQLAENPSLAPVFHDLFSADGATINVVPATRYVSVGTELSYLEFVLAARERGESAIGYRAAATGTVRLNPPKSERLAVAEGDSLIVVGNLM